MYPIIRKDVHVALHCIHYTLYCFSYTFFYTYIVLSYVFYCPIIRMLLSFYMYFNVMRTHSALSNTQSLPSGKTARLSTLCNISGLLRYSLR